MTRKLTGEKRGWLLLWILAVIFLLCVANGQGLASPPNNMHSLPAEKHHGTANKKSDHDRVNKHNEPVHGKDFHGAVKKNNHIDREKEIHETIHTVQTGGDC